MTDPIADYLTRLRNAIKAQHRVVEIPSSKLKKSPRFSLIRATSLTTSLWNPKTLQ